MPDFTGHACRASSQAALDHYSGGNPCPQADEGHVCHGFSGRSDRLINTDCGGTDIVLNQNRPTDHVRDTVAQGKRVLVDAEVDG
jgi:hypothetical protein